MNINKHKYGKITMRWFRFYEDSLDNIKVQSLPPSLFKFWVNLLCVTSRVTSHVTLHGDAWLPSPEEIGFYLRMATNDVVDNLNKLIECNLLDKIEGTPYLKPHNWEKRQYKSDTSAERMKKHRENKKGKSDVTSDVTCDRIVTPPDNRIQNTDITITSLVPKGTKKVVDSAAAPVDLSPPCPHEKIISLYHEILPGCPTVREWNKTRKGYLKQRWQEKKERQEVGWWKQFFVYVSQSDFLTGKTMGRDGQPPFCATLEWLVRPVNFAKVVEGNYHRGVKHA